MQCIIILTLQASIRDGPLISLLEYDQRFDVLPEFVQYDFQHPLKLPGMAKSLLR